MFYQIVERSITDDGMLYVLVRYWATKANYDLGKRPAWEHDHLWAANYPWQHNTIVTDRNGWFKRTDGVFIDPATLDPTKPEPNWERQVVTVDRPAEVERSIVNAWNRVYLKGLGSGTDKSIQRGDLASRADFDPVRLMPATREV